MMWSLQSGCMTPRSSKLLATLSSEDITTVLIASMFLINNSSLACRHLNGRLDSLQARHEDLSSRFTNLDLRVTMGDQQPASSSLRDGSFGKRIRTDDDADSMRAAEEVAQRATAASAAAAVPAAPPEPQVPPLPDIKQYIAQRVLSATQGKDSLAVADALCSVLGVKSKKGSIDVVRLVSCWTGICTTHSCRHHFPCQVLFLAGTARTACCQRLLPQTGCNRPCCCLCSCTGQPGAVCTAA